MATLQERNARLDALQEAVTQYAATQRKALKRQVEVNKKILAGRTGSQRLAGASVEAASALTVDEINEFLTG